MEMRRKVDELEKRTFGWWSFVTESRSLQMILAIVLVIMASFLWRMFGSAGCQSESQVMESQCSMLLCDVETYEWSLVVVESWRGRERSHQQTIVHRVMITTLTLLYVLS